MCRMIGSIRTLKQHLFTLKSDPCFYKLKRCPQCRRGGLWAHGVYYRKGDRSLVSENRSVLLPIPRFFCPHCNSTCSRLPMCLSPRRWYPWDAQGLALLLVLEVIPLARIREWVGACADTVRRWRTWLAERSGTLEFHLRSAFPYLGRHGQGDAFWSAALRKPGLPEAMAAVCRQEVPVP